MFDVGDFISKSIRILNVSYRPRERELVRMAKVTGMGIILIGAIGFIISLIFHII